jgi:hypothetical protein
MGARWKIQECKLKILPEDKVLLEGVKLVSEDVNAPAIANQVVVDVSNVSGIVIATQMPEGGKVEPP